MVVIYIVTGVCRNMVHETMLYTSHTEEVQTFYEDLKNIFVSVTKKLKIFSKRRYHVLTDRVQHIMSHIELRYRQRCNSFGVLHFVCWKMATCVLKNSDNSICWVCHCP